MARCWVARTKIPAGDIFMKSFLEWYKENKTQLEEDAIISTGDMSNNSSTEVVSPNSSAASVKSLDVSKPSSRSIGLSDRSVLGASNSKKHDEDGFFGKDNFMIPQNVLSGEIEKRID